MKIEEVRLVATVADHRKGPREPFPQVAFAGRSNVGKSSLLNVLLQTSLAGTSKSPGKTRTINYYLVNRSCYFVDLPGYGYARVPKGERERWGERITSFLLDELRLKVVVGLLDPRIPTSPLDVDLIRLVRSAGRRLVTVMTKADRLSRGALARATQRLVSDLDLETTPIPFAAPTGAGRREILAAVASALAA